MQIVYKNEWKTFKEFTMVLKQKEKGVGWNA